MARADRRGAQLAFELPRELLERLRAQATAERRTVAALLRGWIEAGLAAGPAAPGVDLSDLSERVGCLERELALLRRPTPPVTANSSNLPASPERVIPAPLVGDVPPGGIETAALADRLGMRRGTLNARIARAGGAAPGLVVEGWRCLGARVPDRGGPARALWVPA
jgi:AraC-like DNA-binding protein